MPSEIWIPTVKLTKENIDTWQPIAQRVDNPFSIAFESAKARPTSSSTEMPVIDVPG